MQFEISSYVYVILGVILIWASINVTNCADGVDGLCTSMSLVTLTSIFLMMFLQNVGTQYTEPMTLIVWMALFMLIGYLWFNCSPSSMLMGDAGSRALGLLIALAFMISGMPFFVHSVCAYDYH